MECLLPLGVAEWNIFSMRVHSVCNSIIHLRFCSLVDSTRIGQIILFDNLFRRDLDLDILLIMRTDCGHKLVSLTFARAAIIVPSREAGVAFATPASSTRFSDFALLVSGFTVGLTDIEVTFSLLTASECN